MDEKDKMIGFKTMPLEVVQEILGMDRKEAVSVTGDMIQDLGQLVALVMVCNGVGPGAISTTAELYSEQFTLALAMTHRRAMENLFNQAEQEGAATAAADQILSRVARAVKEAGQ